MPKNNRPLVNEFMLRVRLPLDLHDRAMNKARAEGRKLSQVVRELLEAYVQEEK